ncbi:hypothetical protein HAP94_13545 [Acidithiobacillus ferrivorans]|nr:hypothetical protein [Acidithiobacillus ferrivorans]
MNLTEKIKSITNNSDVERLNRIIALSDKFNSVRPEETIWDEDRLLRNIQVAKTINGSHMFVIAE